MMVIVLIFTHEQVRLRLNFRNEVAVIVTFLYISKVCSLSVKIVFLQFQAAFVIHTHRDSKRIVAFKPNVLSCFQLVCFELEKPEKGRKFPLPLP